MPSPPRFEWRSCGIDVACVGVGPLGGGRIGIRTLARLRRKENVSACDGSLRNSHVRHDLM
jgi:hypothetical protein